MPSTDNSNLPSVQWTNNKMAEDKPIDKVILPVPSMDCSSAQQQPIESDNRPRRSALAKNISDRRSRSKERRSSTNWSADESTPFLARRTSFRCAICDCDIPFTNCVLCNAEAKGAFVAADSASEIFINEADLVSLTSEELMVDGQEVRKQVEETLEEVQSEKKELEDFYDGPTPGINVVVWFIYLS